MSMHVVPMLFFNLGCEMLYVLDQRLRAQNVPQAKGKKVMADIVTTMFSPKFLDELLKPQEMYSRHALRTMFDRLVHSSIMTVDTDSMDKLYDLMIMAFKYEVTQCPSPKDLVHITLNHMDTVIKFVPAKSQARLLVLEVHKKIVEVYGDMSVGELLVVRQLLLAFLQDAKNKVSVFVNSNTQNSSGEFIVPTYGPVPRGSDVPGVIRYFGKNQKDETFNSGCTFSSPLVDDGISLEINGKRSTKLGCNLYANDCTIGHDVVKNSYQSSNQHLAKAELNLLAHLMGSNNDDNSKEFKLNLFNKNMGIIDDSSKGAKKQAVVDHSVITIDATKSGGQALTKIMQDFNIESKKSTSQSADDDLLSLMDDA